MRRPDAKLVIQVDDQRRPQRIVVMVGHAPVATVTLKELRRVSSQLDHLEVASENGIIHDDEPGD